MIEIKQEPQDKDWGKWLKVFGAGIMGGFALGLVVSNVTYTKNLMDDCETLKQFRVGKLAYTCLIK